MRSIVAFIALLFVVGCDSPIAVEAPRPASHDERQWAAAVYEAVADCLSVPSYHSAARYWVAARLKQGEQALGGAQVRNDLYIAGEDMYQRYILAHEIMHHALWRSTGGSDPDHSDPRWFDCTVF